MRRFYQRLLFFNHFVLNGTLMSKKISYRMLKGKYKEITNTVDLDIVFKKKKTLCPQP